MKALFTAVLISICTILCAQDFRGMQWMDNKSTVKAKEQAIFLEEIKKQNYVEELHYVEFSSGYAYHLYYVFRKDQLIGVKTNRIRLSGENTKFNAIEHYDETIQTYLNTYGKDKIRERDSPSEQAIRIMELKLDDRDVFVTIEKNGNEYYLVENIFKKL